MCTGRRRKLLSPMLSGLSPGASSSSSSSSSALAGSLCAEPAGCLALPRPRRALRQPSWRGRSPGGAALLAHTVVLGGGVAVAHHAAGPALLPAVHRPVSLGPRLTLHTEREHAFSRTEPPASEQHSVARSPRSRAAMRLLHSAVRAHQTFPVPRESPSPRRRQCPPAFSETRTPPENTQSPFGGCTVEFHSTSTARCVKASTALHAHHTRHLLPRERTKSVQRAATRQTSRLLGCRTLTPGFLSF